MQPNFCGHFISAPWRSSGKSLIGMGLARAATRRSLGVQTFKKGPDYIDPLWLKAASSRPCYNLDPYIQSATELRAVYDQHPDEVVIVEGTMGLHDGLASDGTDSNAAVAKQLGLPVLLVVDCRGMHRTIAALVNGLTQFDPKVEFSGIVLNRIRSERHAAKIENAIRQHCDISVQGVVREHDSLQIDERELGLVSALAHPEIDSYLDSVADQLEASCNTDALFAPNRCQKETAIPEFRSFTEVDPAPAYRVGIARDEAFHFYYEDDLDILRSRGVELIEFSPLRDSLPADVDGVLIGGGFPERYLAGLASNIGLRNTLASLIENGLPVRAECGGLMYLCRTIESDNIEWPMVGALNGVVSLQAKPQGRGYMQLGFNPQSCYAPASGDSTGVMPAHEFHHSTISFDTPPECLYEVKRGMGLDGEGDGVCHQQVVASYAHFRHTIATPWVDWFLEMIDHSKQFSPEAAKHV